MRPSKGGYHEAGHVDQLVDGYRPRLTPGNLVRILAKGQSSTDLIHTESTQVFRSFGHLLAHLPGGDERSSARPPPKPEHAAARSARGRQPFKHETVPVATPVAIRVLVGGRPSSQPERPIERASSKARGRTTRGCSGVPRTSFVRVRLRPSGLRGSAVGEGPHTHCTNAGGQQGGRAGTAGFVDPDTGELCRREHPLVPTPSAHRSTAQGEEGGAAANGHGAPRTATESRPGVVTDRPKFFDQMAAKGGTPPARTGWNVT
jgi:hypothetical protein